MKKWHRIGQHRRWVSGAKITESINIDDDLVRFTATISGWRDWKIFEGKRGEQSIEEIIAEVREIKTRIDAGDKTVFVKSASR